MDQSQCKTSVPFPQSLRRRLLNVQKTQRSLNLQFPPPKKVIFFPHSKRLNTMMGFKTNIAIEPQVCFIPSAGCWSEERGSHPPDVQKDIRRHRDLASVVVGLPISPVDQSPHYDWSAREEPLTGTPFSLFFYRLFSSIKSRRLAAPDIWRLKAFVSRWQRLSRDRFAFG